MKKNRRKTMKKIFLILAISFLAFNVYSADEELYPNTGGSAKTEGGGNSVGSTAIYGKDGTDLTLIQTDATGRLEVNINTDTSGGVEVVQDTAGDLNCTEANSGDIKTALEIIDDWDDTNYANVNMNVAGTDVAGNAGVLNAQTVRVTVATDDEINDDLEAIKTAVEVIDNVVSGNEAQVDVITVPAPLNVVDGGTEASALRVTLANDTTGLLSVDDNGSSLTVDNPTISVVGGGAEATAQRVTIASDSTGVLSVDDNGGALTIDGAVTVTSGAITETNSGAIKTAVEIIDNMISGSEAQVDIVTVPAPLNVTGTGTESSALRVTIATDSTGLISVDDNGGALTVDGTVTANAGTNLNTSTLALEAGGNLATIAGDTTSIDGKITACNTGAVVVSSGAITETNSGTILTAVQLEDDTVGTIDSAFSGKVKVIGAKAESTTPTEVADADAVAMWVDTFGKQVIYGADLSTGTISTSPVSKAPNPNGYTQIIDTTLDDDPTTITSSAFFIGDKTKVSFILSYDETEVGNSVSGTLTLEVSPDNSTWYDFDCIFDHTGVPVASIAYTADAEDVFYLSDSCNFPYVRATFAGTNTDADDTIVIDIFICWQK